VGDPIRDPLTTDPPVPLVTRTAFAQPNQLATFRVAGDRRRFDGDKWFASTPHPARTGNEVKYLIDGPGTLAEMAQAIRAATDPARHFVYMLGWTMFVDCPMLGAKTTLGDLFKEVSDRGVQVRIMLWRGWGVVAEVNPDPSLDIEGAGVSYRIAAPANHQACEFVNALPNGQAILDDRYASNGFASHHQKVLIVNGANGLVAFCGGVDVNPDRIFPKGTKGVGVPGAPMHDVHCRVRGPTAADLLRTFNERWADFVGARQVTEKAPLLGPSVAAVAPANAGLLRVQVARTYPNSTARGPSPPYSFAPAGEQTIRTMFLRAIGAATRFIYIEDQYLVNPEAADALVSALGRVQHVTILIPDSSISDLPHVWALRRAFVEKLRKADSRKARIYVRYPFGSAVPHSYIHAKTWIFDDQFAVIGSANCNIRGWTHDSEIGVGIHDESTDERPTFTFAHRLRIRLWAEHLNMDTPEGHTLLADGVASAIRWSQGGTNVKEYDENGGNDSAPARYYPDGQVEPSGT
jgi:phosphatidylserine/phosphatidylglycerophosphate/cardiolipin synthase-like enzyme